MLEDEKLEGRTETIRKRASLTVIVTPSTSNETLREIGSVGQLLLELICSTLKATRRVTVEAMDSGVLPYIE